VSDDDLDMIETERLVDALQRRQGPDGGLMLIEENDHGGKSVCRCWYRGGLIRAMGLNEYARVYLAAELRPEDIRPISGD
jgi:hypothetical protein